MCGFKWVLTNRGTAEWAVWCRAKGGKTLDWGAPQWSTTQGPPNTHTKLGLYLQCFCLSVASLSLQLAAPSDLDPGWRGEAEELSAQGLQLFALHEISRDLQIKLCHCVPQNTKVSVFTMAHLFQWARIFKGVWHQITPPQGWLSFFNPS